MPTATVELLVVKEEYLIVGIRPKSVPHPTIKYMTGRGPDLPEGLYTFSQKGFAKGSQCVAIPLDKDANGNPDPMPLLTACDWLRDRGWTIEPVGMQWLGEALKAG